MADSAYFLSPAPIFRGVLLVASTFLLSFGVEWDGFYVST
jgi:hypothetical protein